jgi:hypothetical protein
LSVTAVIIIFPEYTIGLKVSSQVAKTELSPVSKKKYPVFQIFNNSSNCANKPSVAALIALHKIHKF